MDGRVFQIAVIPFLLVGCDARAKPVQGPDGTMSWYAIECEGPMSLCYDEAAEVCPIGYEIASTQGGMLIRCKDKWAPRS